MEKKNRPVQILNIGSGKRDSSVELLTFNIIIKIRPGLLMMNSHFFYFFPFQPNQTIQTTRDTSNTCRQEKSEENLTNRENFNVK